MYVCMYVCILDCGQVLIDYGELEQATLCHTYKHIHIPKYIHTYMLA